MPDKSISANDRYEQQLREVNEALLISSIRLQEETANAEESNAALLVKQAELAHGRMLLEAALAAGSVATVTWDVVNDIVVADELMAEIFGIDPKDADKLHIADFLSSIHPDDRQRVEQQIARTLETDDPYEIEYRVVQSGGAFRWLYARGRVARDAERKPVRFAVALVDITERKQTEVELGRTREILETRVLERTAELVSANEKVRVEHQKRLRAERERVRILRRLTSAQEDERRKISRDLHDGIGQQITALRFKLGELKRECGENQSLLEKIGQVQDYAVRLDESVSSVSYELRPIGMEDLGLPNSLKDFIGHWSHYHGIPAEFHAPQKDTKPLSAEANSHLYRIAQEALNNILKHAHAKNVSVFLNFQADNLILIIEDDGVGIDPAQIKKTPKGTGGFGLIGIRERCLLLGGQMTIESAPGKGTAILCRIPVEANGGGPETD